MPEPSEVIPVPAQDAQPSPPPLAPHAPASNRPGTERRVVFSLPPIAVQYALRRYTVAGLTMGGVKG